MPSLDQVLAARADLWGDAAMARPEGPTYAFFRDLLPPLRYVNAEFRHYPLVLSVPGTRVKPRLISNGSAINARAKSPQWFEVGTPVSFRVGARETVPFGHDFTSLDGPRYTDGYLPIVTLKYRTNGLEFHQETFAPADERLSPFGAAIMRFRIPAGGRVLAAPDGKLAAKGRLLLNDKGETVIAFGPEWNAESGTLATQPDDKSGEATLLILTKPCPPDQLPEITSAEFTRQRDQCAAFWKARLAQGVQLDVPEPLVNDAWRSCIVGTSLLLKDNDVVYSSGNAYERMYESEMGDVVRALAVFGQPVRPLLPPLYAFAREKGLAYHDAGFKLQLLAHYYWLTRDAAAVREDRKLWQSAVDKIVNGRTGPHGLVPAENYCGDIATQVQTLTTNSSCWKGLHDISTVLRDMGDTPEADRLAAIAAEYRKAILAAADASISRNTDPPFVPVALFGQEDTHETITDSLVGSYWNLVVPYVIGSEVFGQGSPQETWILEYIRRHGGLCMGMIRFHQHSGLYANEDALDDMYTLRYMLARLRRDDVDQTLVTFYGKLAQGFTRDTFVGAEGTGLRPLDKFGRSMYLPPNNTSHAMFLLMLRYMLVQDWDLDENGPPETLRLLYATPRAWLEDGKQIVVKNAPTAFGPLSLTAHAQLSQGRITLHIDLPPRRPAKSTLRLRLPAGWKLTSIENATLVPRSTTSAPARSGEPAPAGHDDPLIDLTPHQGPVDLTARVERTP